MADSWDKQWEATRRDLLQFEELVKTLGSDSAEAKEFFERHRRDRDFATYATQLLYEASEINDSPSRRRRSSQ